MSQNKFLKYLELEEIFEKELGVNKGYSVNEKLTQRNPFAPDLSELESFGSSPNWLP